MLKPPFAISQRGGVAAFFSALDYTQIKSCSLSPGRIQPCFAACTAAGLSQS